MPFVICGIVSVIIVSLSVFLFQYKRNKDIEKLTAAIEERIKEFNEAFHVYDGSYICHSEEMVLSNRLKDPYIYLKALHIPQKNPLFDKVSKEIHKYENLHTYVDYHNEAFVNNEINRCNNLLSNIDGKSLDNQQRTVVVSDEDHNLVLAGAGSGKTLTIAGKVKYLVQEKRLEPSDILLIAFTRKSAEEMTQRIADRLEIPVEATTFHKLGLDIIKAASGSCPEVFDDLPGFVTDFFENHLIDNQETVKLLIEYFAYYLNIPTDLGKYHSLGEVYEHERDADFETIRSKYERSQYIKNETDKLKTKKITLQGETVKSLEEVTIANFLFLNGVNYEYEALYPFVSDNPLFKAYRPDFYLPDYDIYIEHFGIDSHGHTPWLSQVEEEKYLSGISWKRSFHEKNGTKLIETYSYYSYDGVLLEKLSDLLKNNGVEFHKPDYIEIFCAIYDRKSDKYFSEFKKLCSTFITLFKSNGYKKEILPDLLKKGTNNSSPFIRQRTKLFLNIIYPVIESYDAFLKDNHSVDFSDMIIQATEHISNGDIVKKYKYVIIDEYQDISVARYKLVKSILDQTNAHLLCVGDDWQSIYRFAGSDISLFTRFEDYFGFTKTMKLEQTYRNSQQLIDNAERFITKNPAQLKKSLRSSKTTEYPISFWCYSDNPFIVLKKMINKLISDFGSGSSILLLGRTSYDCKLLDESQLFDTKIKHDGIEYSYKSSPETPVFFLTVHKAKGLEADNVILLNFENSILGFPNKISDDPLLCLVLSSEDNFEYAEERRLLYVALTRTKNRVFVLTKKSNPSEFITDFKTSGTVYYVGKEKDQEKTIPCPKCKTGHLLIRKNESLNTFFVGCSNYPQCDYTVQDTTVLDTNLRCPNCGGFLVPRKGKYGQFLGCNNYPQCKYTEK